MSNENEPVLQAWIACVTFGSQSVVGFRPRYGQTRQISCAAFWTWNITMPQDVPEYQERGIGRIPSEILKESIGYFSRPV